MNRGDYILFTIRDVLSEVQGMTVVKVNIEAKHIVNAECYPYIIRETLQRGASIDSSMEDSTQQEKIHFVDIGVLLRWVNTKDVASDGRGSASANKWIDKIERAIYAADLSLLTTTDGTWKHRIVQLNKHESTGYMDDAREVGEIAMIVTATVITSYDA